jgi:flagellar biosynthesis/type III secretory pathway protein FliH
VEHEIRSFAHHQNVQVIPDANLAVGACRVETNRGNVDASIESQLLEIERGLADRLEAAR